MSRNIKKWMRWSVVLGVVAGAGYASWRRAQHKVERGVVVPVDQARQLLQRAAPFLRLPTSPNQPPEVLPDGSGLRCPETGRIFAYRSGILDLLDTGQEKTITQETLDTPLTAWFYDRFREQITGALNAPDFAEEVAHIQQDLQVWPGDVLLDLACGQGNFTVEWAKRAGDSGLVIGLDISTAMLARATCHVNRWELNNVLLIRGDAHCLPFANGVLEKVNCSGGFHQFPDLTQALHEISRVSADGAMLTASTFAQGPDDSRAGLKQWLNHRFSLHFVPLVELGEQLTALGYTGYRWSLPGSRWFGYASASKTT